MFLKKTFYSDFFLKTSIKKKLILFFLILALLPTIIISITLYSKSSVLLSSKIDAILKKNITMMERNIVQKFEAINDISTFIYLNPSIYKILSLSQHPSEKMELINEISILDGMLSSYDSSNITNSKLYPHIYMFNRPEYEQYNFSNKVFDLSAIESETWYRKLPNKSRYSIVGLVKNTSSYNNNYAIRIAKKLYGINDMEISFSCLLTIDVAVEEFSNILDEFKPSKDSSIFIINKNSSVVVSPDYSLIGKDLSSLPYISEINKASNQDYSSLVENINHNNTLVTYKKINQFGWTIVSLSPLYGLYGELYSLKTFVIFIIALFMTIAMILALLLSENISYPIRKLIKSMYLVQNGNFDIMVDYKRNDEFGYLITTYNKMVNQIKELIDKLYVSEARKREAELKALQAQINPHFLYNTLNSINCLALRHNNEDISTMVTSLSEFYMHSLSKGKDIISLNDERKQLESYLSIQKIRFKDKLEYSILFPAELSNYYTVKLVLQPIVENAIIHGIEKTSYKGIIHVTACKQNDMIVITIKDNGIGADIAELNTMLKNKSNSSKSYGIYNVNERLRQYFGNNFEIIFSNNAEAGITVTVIIPAISTLEGFNVNDDNSR